MITQNVEWRIKYSVRRLKLMTLALEAFKLGGCCGGLWWLGGCCGGLVGVVIVCGG